MATGSCNVTITVPVSNGTDPNNIGRAVAVAALLQAAQAIGGNLAQTSGNLVVPAVQGGAPTNIGSWTFTAGT